MKLLQDYKEKKRQKTRIARDIEDEITRLFNQDAQLAHAIYQSLEQHQFEHDQWVYRVSRGTYYDEGGSSRPPSVPQMCRSATVQETSSRGSRDMAYEQISTPTARLRAVEIFLNKDRMDSFGSFIAQRAITSLMAAPFCYSADQQPQDMQGSDCESEGHLSPLSSHGGSTGRGDGGNEGANEMDASYSSRPSTDYFTDHGRGVTVEDDRRSRRSPDEQPREPTQTYHRIRKGKEPVQPHGYPTDTMYGYASFQEVPSSFTGPVQQILIALHYLILHMSHNLLALIQVDVIEITHRSSTRGY
ncbi:hypothetical protein Cgig2_010616 [Carnegiea gigantea]|uniref:Uncharacterized protein n=1 Tax=Carnegiea gigantea TaxID=171969 RepID=A0A9Q1GYI1_9CARY|nr:hypothetical protein Cgig2_010616 [Carnegiea gigantea]